MNNIKLGDVKNYFSAEFATKKDLKKLKFDLVKWMISLFFVQSVLFIGVLFKLLHG